MSDVGPSPQNRPPRPPGHRRAEPVKRRRRAERAPATAAERTSGPTADRTARQKRRGPGCLIVLVIFAVLGALAYVGISKGADAVSGWLNGPEDYSGQGTGSVVVEVQPGDSAAAVGRTLKAQGVVASVEAFTDAAASSGLATSMQPGFYQLRKEMSAEWAVTELADKDNRVESVVTIPEGARVDQVVDLVAENTKIGKKALESALDKPQAIGLPAAAGGNPEGYLFPATYTVPPGTDATGLLSMMVDKGTQVGKDVGLPQRADELGYEPEEIVTVASIVQAEARRPEDFGKVARVIYNRLDDGMALQMDSTVHFAVGKDGAVWTSDVDRDSASPYNTYQVTGLPPGPIDNPGEDALEAALDPTEGDWLYFVTVDTDTGETKFATTYAEHQKNVAEARGE